MGKRQDTRDRIEAQIVESGRRQLVAEGAAGLSLRAIARDLGMVSSAVYRYVASRDDLLTLLLVDAYSELADAVDAARGRRRRRVARPDRGDRACRPRLGRRPSGRLGAAVRQSGTRLSRATGGHRRSGHPRCRRIVRRGGRRNRRRATSASRTSTSRHRADVRADFDRLRDEFGFPGDDAAVAKCFALWAGLVGAINLEVFGQYGADTLSDPAAIFDVQVRLWLHMLAG